MARYINSVVVAVAVALSACGGGENDAGQSISREIAYKQVQKERQVMDSPGERVAVTKAFLNRYPESEYTADAVDVVYYYQGDELNDKPGALAYAEKIRARIDDPEVGRQVDRLLIAYYGEAGLVDKMVGLAEKVDGAGALGFNDRWNVIVGASDAGRWRLVRDYCDRARELATPAALRAENPNHDYSDSEAREAAGEREGMLLVQDGWARANLGDVDGALADLAEADGLVPRYYFDVPEYELNVYWGRTLIMKGRYEAAIEKLATQGLILRNEAALEGLKEAYVRMRGNDAGFDAFASKLHFETATTIDDFEMPDYEGNRRKFSEIRGDVTLLALWFPT
ncbi:MAG: hypothetical protein PVF33_06350 [Candidatus Latescibacterota bacterium]|jgi:hypothetical protein